MSMACNTGFPPSAATAGSHASPLTSELGAVAAYTACVLRQEAGSNTASVAGNTGVFASVHLQGTWSNNQSAPCVKLGHADCVVCVLLRGAGLKGAAFRW